VIGGGMNTGEGIHGSTLVEVSGGTFFNGIAGSGNMNTATKKAGDSSTINISGGTISGNIFGGSITNGSIGSATAANGTNVILSGGVINANIYAGNNTGGTIYGGTNVLLKIFQMFPQSSLEELLKLSTGATSLEGQSKESKLSPLTNRLVPLRGKCKTLTRSSSAQTLPLP
ncbi:MAG: hypothetical protein RR889_09400, partial [Akkermansia sp.]